MKRQLSLVLALVMILGTFTTVFAADTSTDAITEASTFLKDKGVLVGNMSGDLMLGEKLSRQDTAILVSRLMGEYDVAKDFPTAENIPTYEDIKDNFYLPVLAWAQANKTFVGHSAARFGFDDNVTAQEYSKVLLVALGYEVGPETNLDLTWEATLQKAKDLGILKNINDDIKNTDEITRGEMAVMTFNALGVMMKDGTKTLAEKLNIVMPAATKLTAKVNDTMNLKEVVVELSNAKLADSDRLMDASNYKIKGVSVESVRVDGNNVIVTVEKALIKDRNYELTIRNVETGVNGTYNFKALDNTQPTVESVTVLGEYGIKITASEPIKDAKERNFLVDGKNVSMNVEVYGRDVIITPYYNEQFSDKADTLTIKEIEDYSGYKSVEKDFDIKIVKDDVAPKVTDVVAKGNKIEVTFDKDVYNKSVAAYDGRSSVGNISYAAGRQTVYATSAKKIDTNIVEYTFDDEMPKRTKVTISGVQNHSKVTMASVTQEPRVVLDNIEPEIIEKDITKKTDSSVTIELKFNKAVTGDFEDAAKTKFDDAKHFNLYEREAYKGREVDYANITAEYKDKTTNSKKDVIVVTITNLKKYTSANDLNYVLEVENFVDATSSRNMMYRDYVDFKVKADDNFKVDSVSVNQRTNDAEITIKFSKALDKVQAEEFSNYLFREKNGTKVYDVRDLKGSVYLENDGKTVSIILPEDMFRKADFDTLTILNSIKDRDGNRFDKSVVYDITGDVILIGNETANQAKARLVTEKIEGLKAINDINASNVNEVQNAAKAARDAYDALTPEQKGLVTPTTLAKLDAVDAKVAMVKGEAQTLDQAVAVVRAGLNNYKATNATTQAQLQEDIKGFTGLLSGTTVTVKTFTLTPATDNVDGRIFGELEFKQVRNGETTTKTVEYDVKIAKLQKLAVESVSAVTGTQNVAVKLNRVATAAEIATMTTTVEGVTATYEITEASKATTTLIFEPTAPISNDKATDLVVKVTVKLGADEIGNATITVVNADAKAAKTTWINLLDSVDGLVAGVDPTLGNKFTITIGGVEQKYTVAQNGDAVPNTEFFATETQAEAITDAMDKTVAVDTEAGYDAAVAALQAAIDAVKAQVGLQA